MEYALIKDGVVQNVIVADPEFIAGIAQEWDHIERIDTPAEKALGVGVGWGWSGSEFVAPPAPHPAPEPPAPEWSWFIDHGPFTDRLGPAASFAIDTSSDAPMVAIRSDFARRKWIDLKDARVIAAVQYLAGQPHAAFGTLAAPHLTAAQADAVLNTPVAPAENLALRRLYFNA